MEEEVCGHESAMRIKMQGGSQGAKMDRATLVFCEEV